MENTFLSFRHYCRTKGNILCSRLPEHCPLCGRSLTAEPLATPPVRYPPILQSSSSHPFSIVIKPTRGTFICDYGYGDNLHAGIIDSKGFLCQFDERGIRYDRTVWDQCLIIPLLDKSDTQLREIWDASLSQIIQQSHWTAQRYAELGHNCFDFVVAFLNYIHYSHSKRSVTTLLTRQSLVDDYILPTTSSAAKFIAIMKKIKANGFVLQEGM